MHAQNSVAKMYGCDKKSRDSQTGSRKMHLELSHSAFCLLAFLLVYGYGDEEILYGMANCFALALIWVAHRVSHMLDGSEHDKKRNSHSHGKRHSNSNANANAYNNKHLKTIMKQTRMLMQKY